jgi:hypothetical protein
MRAEAREVCRLLDEHYINELKNNIDYFNKRLAIRTLNKEDIRHSVLKMVKLLEQDLKQCEEEYRRDYGDQGCSRLFGGMVEALEGKDAEPKAPTDLDAKPER